MDKTTSALNIDHYSSGQLARFLRGGYGDILLATQWFDYSLPHPLLKCHLTNKLGNLKWSVNILNQETHWPKHIQSHTTCLPRESWANPTAFYTNTHGLQKPQNNPQRKIIIWPIVSVVLRLRFWPHWSRMGPQALAVLKASLVLMCSLSWKPLL